MTLGLAAKATSACIISYCIISCHIISCHVISYHHITRLLLYHIALPYHTMGQSLEGSAALGGAQPWGERSIEGSAALRGAPPWGGPTPQRPEGSPGLAAARAQKPSFSERAKLFGARGPGPHISATAAAIAGAGRVPSSRTAGASRRPRGAAP